MNYTYDLKKLPKNEVAIKVTIPFTDLKPFEEKTAKNISQSTKIEGFRPGKASIDIVKQKVGEQKFLEETGALAIEASYMEIAKKEKLEPLSSPHIEFEKLATGNDFIYTATIPIMPEVKVGEWKSIKIKEQSIEIKEEDIKKALKELQESRAKETLEEKAIAQGDKAELDFDVFRDNVPIENGAQKKYPLVIGSGHFIPGFEEELIGLKAGDKKEFELKFPDEYHNKGLAGKPAKFKVKILGVYKREIPELNEEFAKSLGQESMNKINEQIKQNMEHEQHHKEEDKCERELLEKLIEKSEFSDIPDILITAETNKMIQELESNLQQQGVPFEDYLKSLNKTIEQLKLDFVPQAQKRTKSALIMRQIFFDEKIEISDADIDQELEKMKQMYQTNTDVAKNFETPEYRDYMKNMLGNKKIMDLLKTTCVERDKNKPEIEHNH